VSFAASADAVLVPARDPPPADLFPFADAAAFRRRGAASGVEPAGDFSPERDGRVDREARPPTPAARAGGSAPRATSAPWFASAQ
jgi:hypothetical protein